MDEDEKPMNNKYGISKIVYKKNEIGNIEEVHFYDKDDDVIQFEYKTFDGRLNFSDEFFAFSDDYFDFTNEYLNNSFNIDLGETGLTMYGINSVNYLSYDYDSKGNCISQIMFDENNNILDIYINEFDKKGNIISTTHHNPDMELENRVNYKYDNRNNVIEKKIICASEPYLYLMKNSWTKMTQLFDSNGNCIKRTYYKNDTDLFSDYTRNPITTFRYDNRNHLLEEAYYQNDNELIQCDIYHPHAITKYIYDSKNRIKEQRYYKNNNELADKYEKYCIARYKYNERDNLIEVAYYKTEEEFADLGIVRYKYDSRDNIIEKEYYKNENELKDCGDYGFAIIRYKYNSKGYPIETAYYSNKNELVNVPFEMMLYAVQKTIFLSKNGLNNGPGNTMIWVYYDKSMNIIEMDVITKDTKLIYYYDDNNQIDYVTMRLEKTMQFGEIFIALDYEDEELVKATWDENRWHSVYPQLTYRLYYEDNQLTGGEFFKYDIEEEKELDFFYEKSNDIKSINDNILEIEKKIVEIIAVQDKSETH